MRLGVAMRKQRNAGGLSAAAARSSCSKRGGDRAAEIRGQPLTALTSKSLVVRAIRFPLPPAPGSAMWYDPDDACGKEPYRDTAGGHCSVGRGGSGIRYQAAREAGQKFRMISIRRDRCGLRMARDVRALYWGAPCLVSPMYRAALSSVSARLASAQARDPPTPGVGRTELKLERAQAALTITSERIASPAPS